MTATTDAVTTLGAPVPAGWAAGTWMIDPAHSSVGFAVRHLMSRVRGTFSEVSGQIVTDPDPSRSEATATIGVPSVSTGNHMRDDHLRSADFFDTGHYPVMTFTSTAVRPAGGCWVLSGELTIRDVTRPVELEVEFLGTDPAGLQGETRIGFAARGAISRRDFGITFGLAADGTKIVVGDRVDLTLDVEAFFAA
ncbi:MAG: YceI family protein [Streptosporangiaceae bacterium]